MSTPTKLALLKKAENELVDAAIELTAGDLNDPTNRPRFFALADEYARARWATVTGTSGQKPRPSTSSLKLPIGRAKGTLLSAADVKDLRWVRGVVEENIGDVSKERFRTSNIEMRDAINAELAWRGES